MDKEAKPTHLILDSLQVDLFDHHYPLVTCRACSGASLSSAIDEREQICKFKSVNDEQTKLAVLQS